MRMQRSCTVAVVVALCAGVSRGQGELAITEVVDGTMLNGHPSWVQLTNVGPFGIQDLSAYSLGTYPDGATFLDGGSSVALAPVQLAPGDSYVVCYEPANNKDCNAAMTCFEVAYFAPPSQFSNRSMNGDDAIALFFGQATGDGSDATLVDLYGEFGSSADGSPWDFRSSYAVRCGNQSSSVWQPCDWIVQAPGTLSQGNPGINLQFLRNLTTPFTHEGCVPGVCGPESFCQPSTSTAGCTATLSANTTPMPTGLAGDFVVTANGLDAGTDGLFFFSLDGAANDTAFLPTGTLCLRPPLGRTLVTTSQPGGLCQGQLSIVLNDPAQSWGQLTFPGSEMWVQCFYRDVGAAAGIAVTDGMYVTFQ